MLFVLALIAYAAVWFALAVIPARTSEPSISRAEELPVTPEAGRVAA